MLTLTTQTAIVDISDPVAAPKLLDHRWMQTHPEASGRPTGQSLQDVAVSPDGTTFGLAFGTATVSDFTYMVNAVEGNQPTRWVHSMGDSSTAIALSNNAAYIEGHFCKINRGPGTTDVMTPQMGLDTCTGSGTFGANGVWRTHISAMSLTDGTPLAWNPGQDSFFGGAVLTVTTRGLLAGFDGQRSNSIRTGSVAFYDFGPAVEDTTAPSNVTFTTPAAGGSVNNPAVVGGTATDNTSVLSYRVRIKAADGRWLQPDGTLATTTYEFKPAARADGSFELTVTMPAGAYTAQAKAVDAVGLSSATWASRAFTETGIEGEPPQTTIQTNPVSPIPSENAVSVAGNAVDNVAVASITARITNSAGLYLQPDRTFAAAATDYPLASGALNVPTVDWSLDLGALLPPGAYTVTVTLRDPSGNQAVVNSAFTVAAVAPNVTIVDPVAKVLASVPVAVTGTATDNVAVAGITGRITDAAGAFLQNDGTFAPAVNDLGLSVAGLDTAAASYSFSAGPLALGDYTLLVTAVDRVGNTTSASRVFTVAAAIAQPAVTGYTGYSLKNDDKDRTRGFTFRVTATSQVYALGVQDTNRNGVLDNAVDTAVGIWRVSDRALIATVVVPLNTAVDNGWFYADLPAPVALQAGVTYAVGQRTYKNGEPYAEKGSVVEGANFDYLGAAEKAGSTLTYPSNLKSATGGFGMPNLKIG